MTRAALLILAALALSAGSAGAAGKTETIFVDGRSLPWDVGSNPKLFYGLNDGLLPKVVFDLNLYAGQTLFITAAGSTTTTFDNPQQIGPEGQADFITNDGTGFKFFPSRYFDHKTWPARLNELVGAFVDADGVIIGPPFAIGKSAQLKVPVGAVALSMGINDDRFSDNSGGYTVTISYNRPSVIIENSHIGDGPK